ncbi:MAG: hypothetical protein KAT65_29880 [Methanophagales archaeon]|nr:hypothetical protein [Methanophagales archaeon]
MTFPLRYWESVKQGVQRNKFLISLFFGILIGWFFTAFIELVPEGIYRNTVMFFFGFTILAIAIAFWVADIVYKYGKVQALERFFTPYVIQKWDTAITIADEDGSAVVVSTKEITAEEGEEIPSIRFRFNSESAGDDVEDGIVKVNDKVLKINPKSKIKEDITRLIVNETQEHYKGLTVTIPIKEACPAAKVECNLKYPAGAFRRALNNEEDSYSTEIFQQVRLLKSTLKFSESLSGIYMFDQPQSSFKVVDFHGNKVPHEEVEIIKKKECPIISSDYKELSWQITNPKLGLQYVLIFSAFRENP